MAKLVLSNILGIAKTVERCSLDAGYSNYIKDEADGIDLLAFKKLRIDNQNFLKLSNGDFIAIAGTLIYKGEIGEASLKALYLDFHGVLKEVRDHILGNYMIILKKNNKISVFCEENNLFDVFYRKIDNKWVIGNSIVDVAIHDVEGLSVNTLNVVEYTLQSAIIGNGTIYNEIFKLWGDELLEIDLSTLLMEVKSESVVSAISIEGSDKIISKFVQNINDSVEIISKNFNKHAISMTGGLDSRIIFSSMLNNNIKPNLIYGIGNSVLTNTKNKDEEINRLIAKHFGLNLSLMDWNTPDIINENWDEYFYKYDIQSLIYAGSKNVFNSLENIDTEFVDFGYFGEPYRNVPWIDNLPSEYFTLQDFIDDFYIAKFLNSVMPDFDLYRENLIKKFTKICEKYTLDSNRLSKNDFQKLHNVYRRTADAKVLNFTNRSFYSISILSQKKLLDISEVLPCDLKKDSHFVLKALQKIQPEVLEIPFFSHIKSWTFDASTCKLTQDSIENKNLSKLKNFFKKTMNNDQIQFIARKLYVKIDRNYSSKDKREICETDNIEKNIIKIIGNNEYNILNNNLRGKNTRLIVAYGQLLEFIKSVNSLKNQ